VIDPPTPTPENHSIMTSEDSPKDPSTDTGAGEATDAPTKKKRRRRGKRGGKNRSGNAENETSEAASEGSAEPVASEEPAEAPSDRESDDGNGDGDGAPKKRRGRRGGRGRNRAADGDGEREGGEPRASQGQDESHGTDERPEEEAKKPRKKPAEEVLSKEDWEDIYDAQTFADLGLRNSVVKSLDDAGYTNPTKIQAQLIPLVLSGKDVLGQSRTGSGKTAAFGLPLYHMAQRGVPFQTLILAPTRELAIQISKELEMLGKHTPISVMPVYGGQKITTQMEKLEREPEIIVATPGRLMDMLNRRALHLKNIKFVVLDEVDRMLDIGFREDIRKILSGIKSEHQTVFVSATISEEIEKLAQKFMNSPERLETSAGSLTVKLVDQSYIAVEPWDKKQLLLWILRDDPELAIVFCRMKRTVDKLVEYLGRHGVEAMGIHGDLYQAKRNAVMSKLRSGELRVVIASDLAARGLDVEGITHVINHDLPEDPEVYIHRIGRTARAGRRGNAISFVSADQGPLLTQIESLANVHIPETVIKGFKPGPVPEKVVQEQREEQKKIESKQQMNRYSLSNSVRISSDAKVDTSKFPGGIVPTKMPPKKMGGRVMTTRSVKKLMAEPATENTDEKKSED